ncbi:PolC-type DNA polymerase III [Mycoplasma phocoeninasale]|uniref:DNA polymerase III PolC-type n=1 Tax=Mycoplasma phocoeninasale TaxID=2726117 RepID=A0A858U568_9MOLU|nr:PolC-type DNA polymerase III [Mycoplasma phocoeninasale]MBN0970504.1 PolC-type DNA polymerase III [Mycoplasma phocoeninasale]QJG66373.1 PolC-type DNA polymerase III [Mycoplasma phocoeninasale]
MREKDKTFIKLCKEISFDIPDSFEHARIVAVVKEKNLWDFTIALETHIPIADYKIFLTALEEKFGKVKLNLIFDNSIPNAKIIRDYLIYLSENSSLKELAYYFIEDNMSFKNNEFVLKLPRRDIYNTFLAKKEVIATFLKDIGFDFSLVRFEVIENQKQNRADEILFEVSKELNNLKEIDKNQFFNREKNYDSYQRRATSKKAIDIKLDEVNDNPENTLVSTKGEIFSLESRNLKNDKILYILGISDYSEAITVKKFYDSNEELPSLKVGDTIIISGTLVTDSYANAKCIMASGKNWFTLTEGYHKLEEDNESEKRIELAARSTMSAQDGISSTEDYLAAAKYYGHKAIAITDLDGVQGFPEFYNAAKKQKDIKPIYGATLSAISAEPNFFYGFKDFNLKDEEYVVFDIESTGLSPRFDEIIEFGGTIIKNGMQTNNIQFFIKPSKPVSDFTTNLTGITDADLENGLSEEEGIKKIYDILKNRICVAHNANFDINFCKEKFIKYNLDVSVIKGIDTLAISHFLEPKERKHTLGNLAKRFNVYYDKKDAHRGDYDAEVLCKIWIKIIDHLKTKYRIETSQQLLDAFNSEMLGRRFSYESRILAKNQKGLKKLFKIVSRTLTDHFNEGPKLYFNEIQPDPDLFYGSGTHQSYLWEQAFNGSTENLIKAIKMYDYIEFPPISSFKYLIKEGNITEDNLKFVYKDLINKAKSLNKLCVAVSDSRFIYNYQELIHKIYVNAPSLGGGLHWLSRKDPYPVFKYLNTREMLNEFKFLNDANLIYEIVVKNPKIIASQIDGSIQVIKDKLYVPEFDDSANNLRRVVMDSLYERYGNSPDEKIITRVDKELNPIIKYGYSAIYWISHKLVKRSNKDGYIVGSRGSVGSSIVANLLGISEVNPLDPHYLCPKCKHFEWSEDKGIFSGWDLPVKKCLKCNIDMINDGHCIPFETFLGFEANKVPDIDLNFSGVYQTTIHNYVRELFGDFHTFRAGTISTIADKTAFGFCKKYQEDKRKDMIPWSNQFLDFLSTKAKDVKRTTGQHPGGIIIIPKEYDVEDFTPINFPANDSTSSWKTTHFDFRSIHDNVLKLDLLGHDNPTIIKMLENLTNTKVDDIPKFDAEVMKLFYTTESLKIKPSDIEGETTGAYGLPEFGTNFVRRMLSQTKPKSFNDLILLSGLSHGTDVWAGNADELVKQGKSLHDCVCCRDDILQELVKRNIPALEAFEIMERVRKGKGLTEEQENLLIEKNIPEWYIDSLKKIKYMFPKAHATAYVIMAWRIAWYKLYHPLPFYASYYTSRPDSLDILVMSSGLKSVSDKLKELKSRAAGNGLKLSVKENALIPTLEITKELYARGFKIQNVDLERSLASEWIIDYGSKSLIPPFDVIEGLGEAVSERIILARNEHPFISIEDLRDRAKINSRIESELRNLGILKNLDETNQMILF